MLKIKKFFEKVKIPLIIGLITGCFLIYPMVWESVAHNLLTQNAKVYSAGAYKFMMTDLELNPTSHVFHTGMKYVFHFSTMVRSTTAGSREVTAVLNSNDGTFGSSPGDIYVTYQDTGWATGNSLIIGY